MCAIDTLSFEASHGRKPRGEGGWIFENTATGSRVDAHGIYGQLVRQLPPGNWKVLP